MYSVILQVIDIHTEEEAKHEVMKCLFPLVFYGFKNIYITRNSTNLNTPSFLWAAAKCIQHFLISTILPNPLQSLITENWPLLNLFEERIRSVSFSHSLDLSQRKTQLGLYVFHRLFDHGKATKVTIHMQCPMVLAWLLHGRGSQYVDPKLKDLLDKEKAARALQAGSDDQATPCKRSKLDFKEEESGKEDINVDPQCLCRAFTPFQGLSAGACPWGQIHSLEIRKCGPESFNLLNAALPTFFCLHSLTLHSISKYDVSMFHCHPGQIFNYISEHFRSVDVCMRTWWILVWGLVVLCRNYTFPCLCSDPPGPRSDGPGWCPEAAVGQLPQLPRRSEDQRPTE